MAYFPVLLYPEVSQKEIVYTLSCPVLLVGVVSPSGSQRGGTATLRKNKLRPPAFPLAVLVGPY